MTKKQLINTENTTSYKKLFKDGVVSGVGWAFGVTVGFVLVSTFLYYTLKFLGGLPVVGGWIAAIVESTQEQLMRRSLIIPN